MESPSCDVFCDEVFPCFGVVDEAGFSDVGDEDFDHGCEEVVAACVCGFVGEHGFPCHGASDLVVVGDGCEVDVACFDMCDGEAFFDVVVVNELRGEWRLAVDGGWVCGAVAFGDEREGGCVEASSADGGGFDGADEAFAGDFVVEAGVELADGGEGAVVPRHEGEGEVFADAFEGDAFFFGDFGGRCDEGDLFLGGAVGCHMATLDAVGGRL